MPSHHRRLLIAAFLATFVAACGAAAASPSPQPDPPADAQFRLRVTAVQALPPETTFAWLPSIVITLDGRVLTGGPMLAIFPGPLVNPINERQLGVGGWNRIVDAARQAGLLGGARDFTGGQLPPGSQTTRLQLVADGRAYDLIGDASRQFNCVTTPCVPPPGTPEAFASFVNRLSDLASFVGADQLGPEQAHRPAGFAVIVTSVVADQGVPQPLVDWPLPGGLDAFGRPLRNGSGDRCGLVMGADVGLVRPAFEAATQITPWRDPADGSVHGLAVRPLLPGDGDPCMGLV